MYLMRKREKEREEKEGNGDVVNKACKEEPNDHLARSEVSSEVASNLPPMHFLFPARSR